MKSIAGLASISLQCRGSGIIPAGGVMSESAVNLLRRTTCPHCWKVFAPEDVLWIAAHADLRGDPRLGPDVPLRFLPSRFDIAGQALDARGFRCEQLACPHCHLPVPRSLLEAEPSIVSVLGAASSGKSFFLTALTWTLRRTLGARFNLAFEDADTAANATLTEYEQSLFLHPDPNRPVPVGDLIRKTALAGGDLYSRVKYGNQEIDYPRPFLFAVRPRPEHPSYSQRERVQRLLCLYDNAGEHFEPGMDSTSTPVTRHVAQARFLIFLFDPTQDPRFVQFARKQGLDFTPEKPGRWRQELILQEAGLRVRRILGMTPQQKHKQPLIVVVTKLDVWLPLLQDQSTDEPWRVKRNLTALDRERMEQRSREVRGLLTTVCPELVQIAEDFADTVLYVPVSALGRTPLRDGGTGRTVIRPRDIQPVWVTAPLLYGMSLRMGGLIPVRKPAAASDEDTPANESTAARSGS